PSLEYIGCLGLIDRVAVIFVVQPEEIRWINRFFGQNLAYAPEEIFPVLRGIKQHQCFNLFIRTVIKAMCGKSWDIDDAPFLDLLFPVHQLNGKGTLGDHKSLIHKSMIMQPGSGDMGSQSYLIQAQLVVGRSGGQLESNGRAEDSQ